MTCMPIRSYLESHTAAAVLDRTPFAAFVVCRRYWRNKLRTVKKLGTKRGGDYVDGIHFAYLRGPTQVPAFAGQLSRERRIPRPLPRPEKSPQTNLQPEHLVRAREFAAKLSDGLIDADQPVSAP